ncbi:hypothetical protein F7725_004081 [Dissostichus mawsoni]|uniref:Uncharacterized protein n=1 Tax=Dissostichus mawsoni TaxID=36200 RepID=A0A7J5YCY8_DISMA|nr:hypothetical protein F7725_004081 [Dissostichus mawsoni]
METQILTLVSRCVTPSESLPQSHSLSVTPSKSLPQSHSLSVTPSVSLPQCHSLRVTPSESLPQCHSLKVTPSKSLPQSHSLSVTPSEYHGVTPQCHSLSVTPSESLPQCHSLRVSRVAEKGAEGCKDLMEAFAACICWQEIPEAVFRPESAERSLKGKGGRFEDQMRIRESQRHGRKKGGFIQERIVVSGTRIHHRAEC